LNKAKNWTDYEERLGRVIAYIHDHLDDQLDLNQLAEVACLSPYHWHRIYYAIQGEAIVATVKRLRLHCAAGCLANTLMPIDEVVKKSGYKNLQSFTRIFLKPSMVCRRRNIATRAAIRGFNFTTRKRRLPCTTLPLKPFPHRRRLLLRISGLICKLARRLNPCMAGLGPVIF
jgi:AraC family transcriptional regulator